MSGLLQARIQSEVEKFQNSIHKFLVPLQRTAYQCMADCSDATQTPQSIERCYKNCQHPIAKADNHVQFTIQNFQREIQQCDSGCQGKPNQTEYESCVSGCADKVLNGFPEETESLLNKLRTI